jgi:copper chaperone CopZ
MNTKINLMIAFLFLGITSLIAQDIKTEKFKVYGNCGMCEKRIENAASSVDGVSKADWDKKTKMIEVTYDQDQVKVDDIHKAIADVGHDTEKETADQDVYDDLPGCCKYERASSQKVDK